MATSMAQPVEPANLALGQSVQWEKDARRHRYSRPPQRGTIVFQGNLGAALDGGSWLNEEDRVAVELGRGVRFSAHHGVILRIDRRHPVTNLPLLPWYYAPRPEELRGI